jgi:hypothetical protein
MNLIEKYIGESKNVNLPKEAKVKQVNISQISIGDTVIHNNKIMTVGKNDIKKSSFMGITLFGDSYSIGNKLVSKVIFKKAK